LHEMIWSAMRLRIALGPQSSEAFNERTEIIPSLTRLEFLRLVAAIDLQSPRTVQVNRPYLSATTRSTGLFVSS
jgi:hypothetical protein